MGYRGWVRVVLDDPAHALLYVRFVEDARGRLVIRELYVDATESPDSEPIDSPSAAALPLEELEAWANLDEDLSDWLRRYADQLSPVRLDVLASYFNYAGLSRWDRREPVMDWARAAYIADARAHGLEVDDQPAYVQSRKRMPSAATLRELEADTFTLEPVEGRVLLTDAFLGDVARAYAAAVSRGESSPGRAIADQTGKPLATAQRWVLAARKRGHMPPGRTGVVG